MMPNSSSAADLIQRCRRGEPAARAELFNRYRHYLWVLAQAQVGRFLRAKCDPSDIVQQTLLEAHRDFPAFEGKHEGELLAWMRQILAHNVFNETRRYTARQRDAAREISLDHIRVGVENSSLCLGECLQAEVPSPSDAAQRHETGARLAEQLAQLPEDYRTVLLLRVLEGLPAEEVARRMNRTAGAVRMLQLRALTALREQMTASKD
jgi:RNA polymerase sigma-70 factor, ECF subfamily